MEDIHDRKIADRTVMLADGPAFPPDDARWRRALADAINAADPDDARLARRTWGEVSAETVGKLRRGELPIPVWHEISNLLGVCQLSAADIGQPLKQRNLVTAPNTRRT
jgi:hypothetical protein